MSPWWLDAAFQMYEYFFIIHAIFLSFAIAMYIYVKAEYDSYAKKSDKRFLLWFVLNFVTILSVAPLVLTVLGMAAGFSGLFRLLPSHILAVVLAAIAVLIGLCNGVLHVWLMKRYSERRPRATKSSSVS